MAKCIECGLEWDNSEYADITAVVCDHLEREHGYFQD